MFGFKMVNKINYFEQNLQYVLTFQLQLTGEFSTKNCIIIVLLLLFETLVKVAKSHYYFHSCPIFKKMHKIPVHHLYSLSKYVKKYLVDEH